jgi:flagellar hook-length control protein FliK
MEADSSRLPAAAKESWGAARGPAGRANQVAPLEIASQAATALRGSESLDRPIRIRLTPPELGVLRVEVSRQEGGILARFEVTTIAAQSALNDQLSTLRDSLTRAGLPVERIDVRVVEPRQDERMSEERQDSGDGRHSQSEGRRHNERQQQEPRHVPVSVGSSGDQVVPAEETPSRRSRAARITGADLLDIQV